MNKIKQLIKEELKSTKDVSAIKIGKIANKYYKLLPKDDYKMVSVCDDFISDTDMSLYSIATLWLKRRKTVIDMKYFDTYLHWINNYVVDWGTCDQLCYRVINPMIEKYEQLYEYIIKWSESDNKNIRRVSLVSMIRSSGKLVVYYDIDKAILIADKLKDDTDIHVQKAVGWLLKCSYNNYPNEIVSYLKRNVKNLSRLIFRYALENMPKEVKVEMMKLDYK